MCASVRACVRPSVWDIIQKNKRDLKRESSRESLREEQLQASRQASKQASTRKAFSRSHALEGLVFTWIISCFVLAVYKDVLLVLL